VSAAEAGATAIKNVTIRARQNARRTVRNSLTVEVV